MANPALTDHIYGAAKPEAIEFATSTAAQIDAYQLADKAFNNASNQVGSHMGNYGLSSSDLRTALALQEQPRLSLLKTKHDM